MMASIHSGLEFDDGFEFFDSFAFFDGLTGLCDLSFNSFAGLIDLSLIDGLVHSSLEFFDDFEHFDGLDLTRFSHDFQFFMTHCIGSRQFLGVSGAVFRGSAIW